MRSKILLCILALALISTLMAPGVAADGINITEEWNRTFGGAGDDYGYSVQQTADGGYILAGDTRSYGAGDIDLWLIKTDSKGNEQWSRTFGGAEADLLDRGAVRQTSDGGYIITGYTYSYGADNGSVWLIKTAQSGNEVWNRTFGGEGLDWGHSVQQTSDEGYIIAGRIIPPYAGARADAWLIKTDSNGVEQWNKTFGAGGCEYAASVQQTADGGYIMTGRTTSFGAAEADAWLIRTDSDGIEEWNRTFGGANYDYGYSVQQTSDGGYVIAGSTNGRDDVWLIKTDSNGTEEWNTIFGGHAKDEGYSVQQTTDGGYIAAGYTESYGAASSADAWLIRTDSDGIEQWNRTVGGTGLEKGYSVHQTADGGYIVTGFTSSYGAGGYDVWVIKLSTPIVWQFEGLINPIDAERLAGNNTLITEFGNHSVLEVTPTGETVWQYGTGTAGSGANQLNCPTDAERLASGSTLITDRNNHRVIEVTPAKEIVWQYGTGTAGSGPGQLYNPMDAERLSNGNTLIADRLNNRVIEVNESGEIVWQYEISNPFDADRLSNNNTLIVEYTNHRVIEVSPDKEIVWQYGTGTAGSGVNQLNYPEDAERLSNNNTLITDSLNHRAIEVTPAKEIVWQYGTTGTAGSGAYQLNHPRDAERLANGNTLIADWDNSRVIEVRAAPEEEKEEEEIDLLTTVLEIPLTPYANFTNTISATIKNNGTGDAPSFNVSLSADGSLVNKIEVSGLDAGESVVVNLYWTPSSTGDFELCVAADCDFEVNESNEGNNVLCKNVTVLSFEHPCWNDRFDDETRIAAVQHVIVHGGDVKHEQKSHGGWESDSSLVAGLGFVVSYPAPGSTIAFNITGDGRWNLITGRKDESFYGWLWDGSQWISDPSLIAGLGDFGDNSAPAIAFNITGDGRWNLIAGESGGSFYGWYWNGAQWIHDSSLVAGLGDIGKNSAPAIAFNITGDGRWNLIAGEDKGFRGWYWKGSSEQWVSDSSLVAGLPDITWHIKPAIAFNITGDERWNLIAGEDSRAAHGYSWDGSQWISDYKVAFGLCFGYYSAPAIAFNITGDGMWNLIVREGVPDWTKIRFCGYRYQGGYIDTGSVKSVLIQPSLSHFKNWAVFNANDTVPAGTNITYKILDASGSTIMTVVSGQNISGITQTSIRLYAELTTTNISHTPLLHDWEVCWETGEVDLMPTAIETPAELYANVTTIGAVIANEGDVHSGSVEFNVTLYANEVEVDSKRLVVDDMPPGWSTNVMFYGWTPPHAGTYNLTVIVDSEDEILESNEGNNELTKEVTVLPSKLRRLTFNPYSSKKSSVATDSEGNLHFVWSEDRDGSQLYYKKLAPNGTVLVADKMVSSGSGARIAVDSRDEVHVVFNNGTNPINVSYIKLDNLGNTLIEPKQVISGVYNWPSSPGWLPAKPCGIAVDGSGEVHVVACCNCGRLKQGYRQDLKYVKLGSDGNVLVNYTIEHLTTPSMYGTWDCMDEPSGIAVDSAGSAYTAYSKGLCGVSERPFDCWWPSCLEAYYVKIDSEGVHKQELTGDLPLPSLYPSVCVDSGDNKYVVWSQHNRTATIVPCGSIYGYRILYGFDFYLTKFDKSGNKVIDRKQLTFEDYPVKSFFDSGYYVYGIRRPIIDTESGVIHAAWYPTRYVWELQETTVPEPRAGVWYMAFDTSGDEITNKTLISFEDGDSWEPGIDACKDGAHLVWTDNRDENNEIYYAKMFLPPNRVFILCPSDKWTVQNVTATYAIGVMHTMPGSETFNLTLDNPDGADVAELNKSAITLDPNSIGEVILNVTDAVLGDYRVKVSVESQSNPEINTSAIITTSVIKQKPDLIIAAIDAYHNNTAESPWFNISNEVDVTVENVGTADVAGAFNVSLYAGTEFVGKKTVSGLEPGNPTTVQFKWTPIGADCFKDCIFTDTSHEYNLTAIADCDNDVNESDETNNNLTEVEKACYNGYMADEPLENVFHGTLHGGLLFTTGDGTYGGLYSPGDSIDTTYEITIPAGASVVLARLNVYYTWHYEKDSCPAMEVSITNETGTYVVPLDRDYNDIKCYCPGAAWVFPWGNYVYNLTDHIQCSGTYTVTVKRAVFPPNPSFCIAAPGIEVLYKDETKPLIEYWINEGADVLIGGRRGDGGHLSLEECINNATFPGNVDAGKVEKATLGVVSPWAGSGWTPGMTNYLFFNDIVLGQGVYHGYSEKYKQTMDGITMEINSTNAQVGVNLSDVTDYLQASDNRVGQGDDGDNMMPCNAFLVVEYKEIEVNKTVWDAVNESWVKELDATVHDTLRFRCFIHNVKTSDLTNITVVDILSDSLEYKNNATVNGVPHEPVQAGNEYEWNFTRLEPCKSITIEFDAGVVKYGNCTNILKATAWCEGTPVSGEDPVSITVPCVIPTPFLIYGEVNYSTDSPVLNPDVTITNLNTAEVFTAETNESSNYYQVLTTSENVSAGDVLRFLASNGNTTEFNHTVTEEEMNKGVFEQDIIITVDIPPGSISNLTNVTGNFWINWTWNNPQEDFNYTMVYIDGAWEINVSKPLNYYNGTYMAHATKTISTHTVDSSGNVNETWINQTTTITNNVPVLEAIGDKTVDEGQTVTIDVNATDLDYDTLTHSCNRTDLFADFNRTTGIGSWTPSPGQAGTYHVDFGAADGYGGIDNETIRIIVLDRTPPASISNLSYTNGTTWINWSWTNPQDLDFNYTMVYLNGTWQTNTSYPFYNATALDPDTCYGVGTHTVDKVGNVNRTWVNQTAKTQAEISEKLVFDTGEGTYPSIFGTHKGKIVPDKDIMVSKMYTYPCTGTGGHAEYVKIWNSTLNVNASWNGYKGDWHNISFSNSFILKADETYYYEIITGSYPQIIHASSKEVTGGTITCDKFIDANGRIYNDWIPAIKFFW